MKRIAAISLMLLLSGLINYTFIIKPSSSASVAAAQEQFPVPVRQLPDLQSLTFYIQNGILGGPTPFTFAVNSVELMQRRADPLSAANSDFVGLTGLEFDDVFYSNADGTFDANGRYVTIESVYNNTNNAGLRLAEVHLNFAGGRVDHFNQVASFVRLGGTPGTERNAVDGNLQTNAQMGNTVGRTQRLRLTVGFSPAESSGLVILDAEIGEGDSGTTDAVFRVGVNGSTDSAISVDFTTENFSAVAGTDYLSRTGTMTIPAGQRSANIIVPIIGDTLPEHTQGFFVRMSNARGATISDGEAVGVILDDDDPEAITVCSNDTPKQSQAIEGSSQIESVVRIDGQLLIDDVEVRMHISNQTPPFFGNLHLSADLVRPAVGSRQLFRALTLFPETSIGTTCSPTPDFVVTNDAARRLQDHDGEAPYVGTWRDTGTDGRLFVSLQAAGDWHLGIRGGVLNFDDRNALYTLECWCLSITGPREGLRLTPSRAVFPVFEGIDDGTDFKDAEIGSHAVTARVNANGRPVVNVPVTFTLRDPAGRALEFDGANIVETDVQGRATFQYRNWVPGEYRIEARARVGDATYTDVARVTWTNPCAVTQTVQGTAGAETTLAELRSFRDSRLARSKRGREYSRLYYKLSSEAIRLMMFSPMMVLRSQEMIERYMPVVRDLAAGRSAVLTEGDLDEIDAFMNDFAASGSEELKQTVKRLTRDLRDPGAHSDLGITITPGARRELPSRNGLQGLKRVGEWTAVPGIFLGGVFLIRWRRRKGFRSLLCIALSISGVASGSLPLAGTTVQGQTDSRAPEYSTYFGGSGSDQGTAVTADAEGNIYVAGITDSSNLQTVSAAQPGFGGGAQDAFVAKFDPSGTRLLYLTYLGGSGSDTATGIAVDSSGNAYITGFTTSRDFPTQSALQPNNRGRFNGFVTKLGPAGNLVYSTYLGGTASDSGSGIAVDSSGNAYVAGIATSPSFPTVNALQPDLIGASDVYVAKLNAAGNQLIYSTFLGGGGEDAATAVAVDPAGNVYVTGATLSTDLRVVNAARSSHSGGIFDAFVMKLNATGASLVYSTYLGGGGAERGFRIAADSSGNAYVVGDTFSTDFPTANALQPQAGGSADAFVTKLNANGALAYSTYLGGSGIDGGTAITVDASGRAFITGFTGSMNFPAAAALQPELAGGGFDAFIAKLSPSGSALDFSTYLGGSGTDSGFGIVTGASRSAYAIGLTDSGDFTAVNPIQPGYGGGTSDAFVTRVSLGGPTITRAEVKGKHLNITGSGFERGAVILLDGAQQKTVFKSGASLKGKKAAQRINPGQTVRIQVRNPDGATSSELTFTRAAQ